MYDCIRLVLVEVLADTGEKKKIQLGNFVFHTICALKKLFGWEVKHHIYSTQFEELFPRFKQRIFFFFQTNWGFSYLRFVLNRICSILMSSCCLWTSPYSNSNVCGHCVCKRLRWRWVDVHPDSVDSSAELTVLCLYLCQNPDVRQVRPRRETVSQSFMLCMCHFALLHVMSRRSVK